MVLLPVAERLPRLAWVGVAADGIDAAGVAAAVGTGSAAEDDHTSHRRPVAILPEVSDLWFGRPGLAGHRLGGSPAAGRDWATFFETTAIESARTAITVEAEDRLAGLTLTTEFEVVTGGAIRARHTITNLSAAPYVVDQLDVVFPIDERATEALDMTGRWGRERVPQRHPVRDGVWLREGRTGRPGPESPTMLIAGTEGFGFRSGRVWGAHLAWSGNARHTLERQPSGVLTLGGGELLLPGEVVLGQGDAYSTPWLFIGASEQGLDGLAAQFHDYARSLHAHPNTPRPVVCNVWEAVYFDHGLDRLRELANRAAAIGVELFVLDDGWFGSRRDDHSGLGDWVVSQEVWPQGLSPLVDYVRDLGMRFGLWFEPEMVNPDSELYRAHQDWILASSNRIPTEMRNQLVLDLGRPEVRDYLLTQMDALLSAYPIDYVKWDHNRSLADAGSGTRAGAPGVREQTLGFYGLLDELRRRHPGVEWESCSSGGARIDLGVLQRVERVWTSDMTDALSRQIIQRWTAQLIPPEYLGAHVSAPVNHQTGRELSLDFRAATAFFGDFGVEWDITQADDLDLATLRRWIELYKAHRQLLHTGRVVRADSSDDDRLIYGVVAHDLSEAVIAYVQLDETVHDSVPFAVPGLDPTRTYTASQISPHRTEPKEALKGPWRGEGLRLTGAVLAEIGLPTPARQPLTSMLVHLSE